MAARSGRLEPVDSLFGSDQSRAAAPLERAIDAAQGYLLRRQSPAGWWLGELEADASVSAGYAAVMRFMDVPLSFERRRKIITYCRRRQLDGGAWPAFYGGPPDLNVSIQVYLGLKLAGLPAEDETLQRARDAILLLGGVGASNVFTKIWLALFGQFDWRWTPSVPPEIIFLPERFPINIYEFASWSRQTIMALSIVTALRPVCALDPSEGVDELYLEPPEARRYPLGKLASPFRRNSAPGDGWRSFFLIVDRLIKGYERLPLHPGRKRALQAVVDWITHRREADGGWGGIMLPWIYSLFAFKALGYAPDHPTIAEGLAGLDTFLVETGDELLLQPAMSPVWDTAWAAVALQEAGLAPEHPALQRAGEWLLSQEVRLAGDWRVHNPETEPGGWAFEFENDWYPDMDDSALVPRALLGLRLAGARRDDVFAGGERLGADSERLGTNSERLGADSERLKFAAIERARRWVVAMQSKDGGWAAFDRDSDLQALHYLSFSEFMSPLDPTCADVTAHVIEMLAALQPDAPELRRAVDYLQRTQEADGAWYGRWGVNYLYGTGLALAALAAAGEPSDSPAVQPAVSWLLSKQNPDGGWGETCRTYLDPAQRGLGPSTASQTAWVLIGLASILSRRPAYPASPDGAARPARAAIQALRRGVDYLLRTQRSDGGWDEIAHTGGGFPKVFYLRYELYKDYFPLLALARVRSLGFGEDEKGAP